MCGFQYIWRVIWFPSDIQLLWAIGRTSYLYYSTIVDLYIHQILLRSYRFMLVHLLINALSKHCPKLNACAIRHEYIIGGFPSVIVSEVDFFNIFLVVVLNKQSTCRWFGNLWGACDAIVMLWSLIQCVFHFSDPKLNIQRSAANR